MQLFKAFVFITLGLLLSSSGSYATKSYISEEIKDAREPMRAALARTIMKVVKSVSSQIKLVELSNQIESIDAVDVIASLTKNIKEIPIVITTKSQSKSFMDKRSFLSIILVDSNQSLR